MSQDLWAIPALRIRSHSSSSASSTGGERRATAHVVLLRRLHVLRCARVFAMGPGRLGLSLPQNVCALTASRSVFAQHTQVSFIASVL